MAEKIGCFVCTGCRIGEALDADKLLAAAAEHHPAVALKHEALCQSEGRAQIEAAIGEKGLDGVIVGACSFRDMVREFSFDNVVVERANLREGVAWSHEPGAEDTLMLGEDAIRMAFGRMKFVTRPLAQPVQVSERVLVIGGGVSGLSAALHAARAGRAVTLVERETVLGGFARELHKVFPRDLDIKAYRTPSVEELIEKAKNHAKIEIRLGATVQKIAGAPGLYTVTLSDGSELRADTVVVAAGFKPYDALKLQKQGYGLKNVITNVELERMAKAGKIARPSDGAAPASVLFVQCAGSRDEEHLPHCSNVCCAATLKQLTYLKEQDPAIATYVLYKDIRAPGHYEDVYKRVQKQSALFIKGEVESIEQAEGDKLAVRTTDVLMQEPVAIEADLVVLATGMQPTTLDTDVLNLQYRQGPELPEREGGFPNSHYICFPYETQRTGVFAAGAVRMPMDQAQALEDGAGAAFKAIQAIELIREGRALFPRVGDIGLPDFNLKRCTQCKRCTEECPFGALNEDVKGTPEPNPTRCRRCGICMGACPERIVEFPTYNIQCVSQQIKNIFVPDEFEEKPRVLCLACENDAMAALDLAAHNGLRLNPYVRVIPLRCLGSFNIIWVADALSKGIDGLILLGCKSGDDLQCHYIKGSELCQTRLTNVQDTLNRLMLEADRLRFEQVAIDDYWRLPGLFDKFVERLIELGPNPYKS